MLDFYFSNEFKGKGISKGLERGLLVSYSGLNLVQEGMGLGAPAIKSKNRTFFSRTSKLKQLSENEFAKDFYIDSEMVWEILKLKAESLNRLSLLTTFVNNLTDIYKKFPHMQRNLLKLGIFSRNFFQVKSKIIKYGYIGTLRFYYTILNNKVEISVDFSTILKKNKNRISKVCILNELGGDFFNFTKIGDKILPPPVGWVKKTSLGDQSLYSKDLELEFNVEIIMKPSNFNVDFIYGRENISNFCWAGFDIEINITSAKDNEEEFLKYICTFKQKKRYNL